jgi:hypothetical protein
MTGDNRELLDTILPYFDLCVDEISAQQKLLAAENNELQLSLERFSLGRSCRGWPTSMPSTPWARARTSSVEMETTADEVISDRTIVHRICMNLLKNALEATDQGGIVPACAAMWAAALPRLGPKPRRHVRRRAAPPLPPLLLDQGPRPGPGRLQRAPAVHELPPGRVWFETGEDGTAFHVRIPQGQELQQA